ncbi:hypothetical protein IIA16_01975, partial [bacterium]|nr:hypothetical protein [bacterium]
MNTHQGRVESGRGNLTGHGWGSLFCLFLVAAALPPEDEEMTVLPTVRVVGSSEEARRLP